jgi:ribonuclease HI
MIKIYTDAGSRGNPGKSACAFLVLKDDKIIEEQSKFLGVGTNNEAEYNAIILALEYARQNNLDDIELTSDSELVIRQIKEEYKIRQPHLRKLFDKVQELTKNKKIKFFNAKREDKFISRADSLVNHELDKQ